MAPNAAATDLECDQMILSPDDHRSLQAIDGELATCEPHLAAMFRIFTRLNADEPAPPSEDLIMAIPRPPAEPAGPSRRGWRGRRRSRTAQARLSARARAGSRPRSRRGGRAGQVRLSRRGMWRPVAAITLPAVLLVTMLMVLFFTLSGGMRCRPAPGTSGRTTAQSAVVAAGGAALASCQSSGTAKAGTAKAGTAKAGTAKAGTADGGTAQTGSVASTGHGKQ
jgi:hypothetical protein